jgi:DNA-binding GntR family transcriptional regulator
MAYARFRESLFDRRLKPGQFVSQRELSELLDVPMGAIREALKRLEADGLINLIAQRGVQIADVNVAFINEAFEFRILIETEAARRSANIPDRERLNEIRAKTQQIIDQSGKTVSDDLMQAGLQVDLELHEFLVSVFTNGLIRQSHQQLEDKVRLIRMNGKYTVDRLRAAMLEHLDIIDALLEGDEQAAVASLNAHLKTSWRRSLGLSPDMHGGLQ